jgi:hypothetical protein
MSGYKEFFICDDAQTLKKSKEDGVMTAWDRFRR